MPQAVIKKGDPLKSALSAGAGALAGAAEGEQRNEERRKFDVSLAEQVRQYDADMRFRIQQLEEMSRQQQLTREHQTALETMKEEYTNWRQENQQHFLSGENALARQQETSERLGTEAFTAKENLAQRKLEDKKSQRIFSADMAATQQRREAANQEYLATGMQLFGQQERINAVGQTLSKYGVPGSATWNEEAAFQEYLVATTPTGTTTGQAGIPQLTPAEVQAKRSEFARLTRNYEVEKKRNLEEIGAYSEAKARGELVARGEPVADDKTRVPDQDELFNMEAGPDAVTGLPPMRLQTTRDGRPSVLSRYSRQLEELDDYITDVAYEGTIGGGVGLAEQMGGVGQDTAFRGALADEAMRRVEKDLSEMDVSDPVKAKLRTYFEDAIFAVLELTPAGGAVGSAGEIEVGGTE